VEILLLLPLVHPFTFLCISMMRSTRHLVVWLMEIDSVCCGPTRVCCGLTRVCFGPTNDLRNLHYSSKLLMPWMKNRYRFPTFTDKPWREEWFDLDISLWRCMIYLIPYKKVPFWNQTIQHYNQCNQALRHKLLVQDLKQLCKYGFHKCHAHKNTHCHKTKPQSIRYLELLDHP
jgi:hypothetical protein